MLMQIVCIIRMLIVNTSILFVIVRSLVTLQNILVDTVD